MAGPFVKVPVPGGTYGDSWGAPRTGHDHQGVDIFGPEGREIWAPFDGVLRFSYRGSSAGWAADVDGPDGVVRNFHCTSRRAHADGRVKAGTVIGYVDRTGNATATSPHSHFEWHPGVGFDGVVSGDQVLNDHSNGTAHNPFKFLNEVYTRTKGGQKDVDPVTTGGGGGGGRGGGTPAPHATLAEIVTEGESWVPQILSEARAWEHLARDLGRIMDLAERVGTGR